MMALMRWDPFREMIPLREVMDRLFDESIIRPELSKPLGAQTLAVDVEEEADDFVIKASVPGLKPEDLKVNSVGDTVTLSSEIQEETERKETNFLLKERRFGSFKRTVTLPQDIDTENAEATFEDGVLTLAFPKPEESKAKTVQVKAKQL